MKNTKKEIHKKSLDLLDKHLDNMTKKEKDDMREIFRDKRPKGWLSIEEHPPIEALLYSVSQNILNNVLNEVLTQIYVNIGISY